MITVKTCCALATLALGALTLAVPQASARNQYAPEPVDTVLVPAEVILVPVYPVVPVIPVDVYDNNPEYSRQSYDLANHDLPLPDYYPPY